MNYRYALASLVEALKPGNTLFLWLAKYAVNADVEDPIRRAWDECRNVETLCAFLTAFKVVPRLPYPHWNGNVRPVEYQNDWVAVGQVQSWYEVYLASGVAVVCDTKVQLVHMLEVCPITFDQLIGTSTNIHA